MVRRNVWFYENHLVFVWGQSLRWFQHKRETEKPIFIFFTYFFTLFSAYIIYRLLDFYNFNVFLPPVSENAQKDGWMRLASRGGRVACPACWEKACKIVDSWLPVSSQHHQWEGDFGSKASPRVRSDAELPSTAPAGSGRRRSADRVPLM